MKLKIFLDDGSQQTITLSYNDMKSFMDFNTIDFSDKFEKLVLQIKRFMI